MGRIIPLLLILSHTISYAQQELNVSEINFGSDTTIQPVLGEAEELFKEGWTSKAIKKTKKCIKHYPEFYGGYLYLGYLYYSNHESNLAIEPLNYAVELTDEPALAYFMRGNCFLDMSIYSLAIRDFDLALRHDSTFYKAFNNLAYARMKNQGTGGLHVRDLKLAKNELMEIMKDTAVDDKTVYFNLGVIMTGLGDYQEAEIHLLSAIEEDENFAKAYFYLGLAQFYHHDWLTAQMNFEKAETLGYWHRTLPEFLDQLDLIAAYIQSNPR